MNENETNKLDEEIIESKPKRLDKFFNDQGYGNYQIQLFLILSLILFSDALQMLLTTLIIKSLKKEFDVSNTEKSFLLSSAFIGLVIGSFFASKYIDIYGRKPFVIYGGLIFLIFSILSAFSSSVFYLILFRVILGIGIGVQMPACINLTSESIPKEFRSVFLSAVWVSYPLGEIYCSLFAWYLMPHFEKGMWRNFILACCAPIFVCLLISIFLLESARYYYSNLDYERGKQVLKEIEAKNKLKYEELPFYLKSVKFVLYYIFAIVNKVKFSKEEFSILESNIEISEKDFLEIEQESKENVMNYYSPEWRELFNQRFIGITLKTWTLWSAGDVGLYLTIYLIPQLLIEKSEKIKRDDLADNSDFYIGLLIAALIALPKAILAGYLGEYVGRLKSMTLLLTLTAVFSILMLLPNNLISLYGGIIKLLGGAVIMIIKVYSVEIYPTKLRGLGSSVGHSVGRLVTVFIPFISQYLVYLFNFSKAPFLFVLFMCIIGAYSSLSLKYETKGKDLDSPEKEDKIFIDLKKFNT